MLIHVGDGLWRTRNNLGRPWQLLWMLSFLVIIQCFYKIKCISTFFTLLECYDRLYTVQHQSQVCVSVCHPVILWFHWAFCRCNTDIIDFVGSWLFIFIMMCFLFSMKILTFLVWSIFYCIVFWNNSHSFRLCWLFVLQTS